MRDTHQLLRVLRTQRERLLDEHVLVAAQRLEGQPVMGFGRGGDDQRIHGWVGQQLLEIADASRRRRSSCHRRQRLGIGVTHGEKDRATQLAEASRDVASPSPGPRQGYSFGLAHRYPF